MPSRTSAPDQPPCWQVNLTHTRLRVARMSRQLDLIIAQPGLHPEAQELRSQLEHAWQIVQQAMAELRDWVAVERSVQGARADEESQLRAQALMAADWSLRADWMALDGSGRPESVFAALGSRYRPQPQDRQADLVQARMLAADRTLDEDAPLAARIQALFERCA